jgi:hypothetical protein
LAADRRPGHESTLAEVTTATPPDRPARRRPVDGHRGGLGAQLMVTSEGLERALSLKKMFSSNTWAPSWRPIDPCVIDA